MSAIKNTSLFIPHVFPNFDKNYVADAFAKIGEVNKVDFVAKQDRNGKQYNAVYVHFKRWYDNRTASVIQFNINMDGSAKFYHDDSDYYWIVLPNTANKHVPGDRKQRIDMDGAKSISVKSVENKTEKVNEYTCPSAPKKPSNLPKKPSYAEIASEKPVERNLEPEFEECLELLRAPIEVWENEEFEEYLELLRAPIEEWETEEEAQMAEMEAEMEAEDENLVSIDWRYVQTIEQENTTLLQEVAQLRVALINLDQMYQAEKAKVRAFSNVETSVDL